MGFINNGAQIDLHTASVDLGRLPVLVLSMKETISSYVH